MHCYRKSPHRSKISDQRTVNKTASDNTSVSNDQWMAEHDFRETYRSSGGFTKEVRLGTEILSSGSIAYHTNPATRRKSSPEIPYAEALAWSSPRKTADNTFFDTPRSRTSDHRKCGTLFADLPKSIKSSLCRELLSSRRCASGTPEVHSGFAEIADGGALYLPSWMLAYPHRSRSPDYIASSKSCEFHRNPRPATSHEQRSPTGIAVCAACCPQPHQRAVGPVINCEHRVCRRKFRHKPDYRWCTGNIKRRLLFNCAVAARSEKCLRCVTARLKPHGAGSDPRRSANFHLPLMPGPRSQ